ncbi:hypothetical protein TH63_18255 [Rufibacter radiotolerans]|uniref:Activator of Hsp90 ATPase homologue 1/2-like C-terminal domain-containing protein n=1 Tax=Rufibacter radiotolerans TaxID=1379910 RepID=A0A0H4VT91_9BACT|nr:SRPBCC domain-containing protein [Rufibacter radiotolerans]AKQ47142.1 hypothetical protein TH63_18255 [Rufibacter radiotolerans]
MENEAKTTVTVETTVQQPVEKVWERWTTPEHITQWNFAADTWQCPNATNDLQPGGRFVWRMEAKDGSMGFDYSGTYEQVIPYKKIVGQLDDDRQVTITFDGQDGQTQVTETFEVEDQNSVDLQRAGWQAILDNFKKHAESVK